MRLIECVDYYEVLTTVSPDTPVAPNMMSQNGTCMDSGWFATYSCASWGRVKEFLPIFGNLGFAR
jgi:hypothetical protein